MTINDVIEKGDVKSSPFLIFAFRFFDLYERQFGIAVGGGEFRGTIEIMMEVFCMILKMKNQLLPEALHLDLKKHMSNQDHIMIQKKDGHMVLPMFLIIN